MVEKRCWQWIKTLRRGWAAYQWHSACQLVGDLPRLTVCLHRQVPAVADRAHSAGHRPLPLAASRVTGCGRLHVCLPHGGQGLAILLGYAAVGGLL